MARLRLRLGRGLLSERDTSEHEDQNYTKTQDPLHVKPPSRLHPGRWRAPLSMYLDCRQLPRSNQVDENVPLRSFEYGEVTRLPDSHFVADDFDFGTCRARRAQGHLCAFPHCSVPPSLISIR